MYWILYWEWQTEQLCGCRWQSVYRLSALTVAWLIGSYGRCLASQGRMGPQIVSLGQDPNSKCQYSFYWKEYWFCTSLRPNVNSERFMLPRCTFIFSNKHPDCGPGSMPDARDTTRMKHTPSRWRGKWTLSSSPRADLSRGSAVSAYCCPDEPQTGDCGCFCDENEALPDIPRPGVHFWQPPCKQPQ